MKQKIFILFVACILLASVITPVTVQAQGVATPQPQTPTTQTQQSQEGFIGLPLCQPGVYLQTPIDCLLMGPSQKLTDLARKGLTLPLKPLPAVKPDPALVLLSKKFAKLNLAVGDQAAYYPNLQSAEDGIGWLRKLPPGQLQYVSYINAADVNGHHFVQSDTKEWVRASPTRYSSFQGLLFTRQPSNDFGWIVDDTNPRIDHSSSAKALPIKLTRETVVQVYDKVDAEGTAWYMIGLGQWVEQRYIRVVDISEQTPKGVDNNRWIEVNLDQQILTVHDQGNIVFATLIATGMQPFYTKPGLFKITVKKEFETMTGAFETGKADYYYLQDVPWTMYFDQKRALHGAYWRLMFGYPVSHGCVNISIGDSHWLFDWAKVNDWVYVWDPSGKTPTDPKFYGAGGA